MPEGSHVLLVEDLATDGGSKLLFADALREAGAICNHAFVVFYYDLYSLSLFKYKNKKEESLSDDEFGDIIPDANLDDEVYEEEIKEEIEDEKEEETIQDETVDKNILIDTKDEEDIKLKVEKTVDEKQSSTLSSDVYDPSYF